MFNRKVKLAQTQEDFDAQVSSFLLENGFPDDQGHRATFAQSIQMLPADQDFFHTEKMARQIRKAKAGEYAFYVMYPNKRPQKDIDESQATSKALEQKA
jgi:hypothetical protein